MGQISGGSAAAEHVKPQFPQCWQDYLVHQILLLFGWRSEIPQMDQVYGDNGTGDSISVTFSQDADAAGMIDYTFAKAMVDNLFSFSRPIGL